MDKADSSSVYQEEEIDRGELTDLIIEFVRLGKDTGRVVLTSSFEDLALDSKAAVIMLAERLRKQMEYSEDIWLTPEEISEMARMEVGTIYPGIRKLEQDGIIEHKEGRYCIPAESFDEAKARITN